MKSSGGGSKKSGTNRNQIEGEEAVGAGADRNMRGRMCCPGQTDSAGETPTEATETVALVRLRMSVHRRVEVPLWRGFPPRVESNCVLATGRGEQLE
ncbi:MAG: hypothetical protein ACLQVW_10715, partial [Limisphaerales bacterium]